MLINAEIALRDLLHEKAHNDLKLHICKKCVEDKVPEPPCDPMPCTPAEEDVLSWDVHLCVQAFLNVLTQCYAAEAAAQGYNGQDPAAEAFADYAAFLCLCWQACQQVDPQKRQELMDAANQSLARSQEAWSFAVQASMNCVNNVPGLHI